MRRIKTIAFIIVLFVFALSLTGCQESDEAKYKNAQSLLAKGEYAEAAKKFDELGSYEEASKLSMYCKAAAAGESGDYETAFSTFKLLGDYKESQFMITYYQARRYESTAESETVIQWGNLISAAQLYDSLVVFHDSKERAEACRKRVYDYAVESAGAENYNDAIRALNALDQYSDSALLSQYYAAFRLEQEGDFAGASAKFAEISSYKDAKEQTEQVMQRGYDYAASLEENGDQLGAYNAFIKLGGYKDSFERACKPYYVLGETYRTNKEWSKAVAAFTQAGKYSDAATQVSITYYAEGEAKRSSQDWDGAVRAFKQAGKYNDASTQVLATYYTEGEAKRAAQEWEDAENAFANAGNYNDAPTQVLATYYAEGEAKRSSQDWEGAMKAFGQAGDYGDSIVQLSETQYLKAMFLLNNEDYSQACDVLLEIRGYKDADSLLTENEHLVTARETKYKTVGSIITFGRYEQDNDTTNGQEKIEWIVLDYDEAEHKALLLSRYGLDVKPYNTKKGDITWAECSLRTWLNGEFLQSAFSADERSAILTTLVDNGNSQGYNYWHIKGEKERNVKGGENTQDQVFLLSYKEARQYLDVTELTDNTKPRVAATAYAIAQGASAGGLYDSRTVDDEKATYWWLRSPGFNQDDAALVYPQGSLYTRYVYDDGVAVCPAFWLNLDANIF